MHLARIWHAFGMHLACICLLILRLPSACLALLTFLALVQAGFYLENQQLPVLAAQARQRQITGSRLLAMQLPADLAAFDVPVAEKTAAFPILRKLQHDYPLPFAAQWSVADVSDWLKP